MAKTINAGFITAVIDGISVDSSIRTHVSNYNNLSSRNVGYVVFHYTGNAKDAAKANANYFAGANRKASAHFFVDDSSIYQGVELRDTAWHCGGSSYYHSGCRNANAFGIEMCCTAGNYRVSETTKRHAAHLGAYLCGLLGITADQVDTYVLRHYDITHKSCPAQMAGAGNAEWATFKEMIKQILRGQSVPSSPAPTPAPGVAETPVGSYTVKITADELNVRSGPGTNYPVVTAVHENETYTIVAESNGWGKLKSGAGWISLAYTTKVGTPTASKPTAVTQPSSYRVRVTADVLNIRSGPGVNYAKNGSITKGGVYTIVETKNGWGKLKSGAGWISLEFTTKL